MLFLELLINFFFILFCGCVISSNLCVVCDVFRRGQKLTVYLFHQNVLIFNTHTKTHTHQNSHIHKEKMDCNHFASKSISAALRRGVLGSSESLEYGDISIVKEREQEN